MASHGEVILELNGVGCSLSKDKQIFHDINLDVRDGDILVLRGKSGSGKSTLLKCFAHLILYDGDIRYRGKKPKTYGIPMYRTHVLYVPQRPSMLPGTPKEFIQLLFSFSACRSRTNQKQGSHASAVDEGRAIEVAAQWGIDAELWDRPWATLSGGESQRIALASAVGLNTAEVLLLDEPTSALDAESSGLVEQYLKDMLHDESVTTKALVWITHSDEQGRRVGTRFVQIVDGSCKETHPEADV